MSSARNRMISFFFIATAGTLLGEVLTDDWPHAGIVGQIQLKGENGVPEIPTPNPWFPLARYERTITRAAFEEKLHKLYDPFGGLPAYEVITDEKVNFYPSPEERRLPIFTLIFAPTAAAARPVPRWFRTPAEFRAETHPADRPLAGLRIAIDPGHIGGPWAQLENRSTCYRGSAPVQEGDLNLITARILKAGLEKLGAEVFQVRDSTEPVTPYRPNDLLPEARQYLIDHSSNAAELRTLPYAEVDRIFGSRLLETATFLFYRSSEIRERGNRIRNNFVPDLTVTLYIDATPGSAHGRVISDNSNIFFVHGSYVKEELKDPYMRLRCVNKLLEGGSEIEKEVAGNIAAVFKQTTGLPPVMYGDSATTREVIPGNLYVVARNLAANREYDGPVVCTEPYFMNNEYVYQRLLAGDYAGVRLFKGKPFSSIFQEYAHSVLQGLLLTYAPASGSTTPAEPAPEPNPTQLILGGTPGSPSALPLSPSPFPTAHGEPMPEPATPE